MGKRNKDDRSDTYKDRLARHASRSTLMRSHASPENYKKLGER